MSMIHPIKNLSAIKGNTEGVSLSKELTTDKEAINQYIKAVESSISPTQALSESMYGARQAAVELAESLRIRENEKGGLFVDTSDGRLNNFLKDNQMLDIQAQASSKSWMKYKNIINEFNSATEQNGEMITDCGLSVKELTDATGAGNTAFGKYLQSTKVGQANMKGLALSMALAKVETIGLQAASMALNMALSMGVSFILNAAIKAIADAIVTTEELHQNVQELMGEFEDSQSTIKSHQETIDNISDRYNELADGVDEFGKNVSLTTDEFKEYHDITNQIADMFPNMVQGWDKEGNAIIRLKGNVDALVQSLQNERLEASQLVLSKGNELMEDFQNQSDAIVGEYEPHGATTAGSTYLSQNLPDIRYRAYEILDNMLKSENLSDYLSKVSDELHNDNILLGTLMTELEDAAGIEDIRDTVLDTDYGEYLIEDDFEEKFKENKTKIASIVTQYNAEVSSALKPVKNLAQQYLYTLFNSDSELADGLSENMQSIISSVANNISFDTWRSFNGDEQKLYDYLDNYIEKLKSLSSEEQYKIEAAANIITAWNNDEISIEEFKSDIKSFDDTIDSIDNLSDDEKKNIKIAFDLDTDDIDEFTDTDKLENQILDMLGIDGKSIDDAISILNDNLNTALAEAKTEGLDLSRYNKDNPVFGNIDLNNRQVLERSIEELEKYKEWIDGLTKSDLEIVQEIIVDTDTADWQLDDWQKAVESKRVTKTVEISINDMKDNLEDYAKGVKALDTAYGESKHEKKVSFDNLMDIQDAFSDVDGIDGYIKELSDASISAERFNEILSKLTYAELKNKFSSEELVSAGEDLIKSLLETNGVSNASTVATQVLTEAQHNLYIESARLSATEFDLSEKANQSYKAIADKAGALKVTTKEYLKLIIAENTYSNKKLDVSQKISALQALEKSVRKAGDIESADGLESAIAELAYAKLQETYSNNQIVKSTEEVISARLKEIGVSNSDAVAKDVLAIANARVAAANYNVLNTANLESSALINAANSAGVTTTAFANLVAQEQIFNNSSLNVSQKISALQALAAAAGGAANVFTGVADIIKNAGAGRLYTNNPDKILGLLKRKWNEAMSVPSFTYSAPSTNYSGSTYNAGGGNSGSGSGNSGSGSGNKAKTALEKFRDWLANFFDWIEIKLERQSKVIEKYVSRAEELLGRKSFEKAGEYYRSAIAETTKQVEYESQAVSKYNAQASKVLSEAQKKGLISAKTAKGIINNTANGIMSITTNGEVVREVIKEYQNWINKAKEASNAMGEMQKKIQDYTKSLKDLRDAQRDATINRQKTFLEVPNSSYVSTSGGYYGFRQTQLDYQNTVLSSQINAYNTATSNSYSDLISTRSYATNTKSSGSIDKLLANKTVKGAYRTALKNAKSAMNARKKVPTDVMNVIKDNKAWKVYEQIFAYNLALDNLDLARQEQALNFAEASAEIYEKIAESYENIRNAKQNSIDINKQKSENETSASSKNSLLRSNIGIYSEMLVNDAAEVQKYSDLVSKHKTRLSNKSASYRAYAYNNLSKQGKANVDNLINQIKLKVSKGHGIPANLLAKAADYYSHGYIMQAFYESCIAYNNALEHKREAIAQQEINKATIEAEKEAIGTEMLENIEQEYTNKLDANQRVTQGIESARSLIEARRGDIDEDTYKKLITQSKEREGIYSGEIASLRAQITENLSTGIWDESSQAYQDALQKISDYEKDLVDCQINQEELKVSLRDDVYWRTFERAHDAAKRLSDVLSGINNLISDDMLYNSQGKMTEFGLAQLSTLTKQYDAARKNIENYINDIENLNKLKDQYTPLEYAEELGKYEEGLLSEASGLKSIVDNILDYYKTLEQKELDGLSKIIDARKKALDAKKEYYDYDKTLKSKNKDIQYLRAQVSALEGIEDMSARAKRAQLQAQLTEAEDELNDIVTQHQFELSSKALDGLKETMQEAFDNRWADISSDFGAIKDLLDKSNTLIADQSGKIAESLGSVLSFYGIGSTAQAALNNTIANSGNAASGVKNIGKNTTAWTQDGGREFIIRKSDGAILTPLKKGDSVIPNELTENLFAWGSISPDILSSYLESGRPTLNIKQPNVTIDNHYDALLNIEGNVDSTVVTDVKKFAKQFYEGAYEYTKKEIVRDARKLGI